MAIENHKITAIIPALNEEKSLPRVIGDLPASIDEIIVCDNGSSDNTARVAADAGAVVVYEPIKGYGAACLKAAEYVKPDTDILLFIDGDYSDFPEEAEQLIRPIIDDQYDLVIGSRMLTYSQHKSLPPAAAFGNWLTTLLIRLIWRKKFTDIGPFRAIRYQAYQQLEMKDRDFGWTTEMQVKAVKTGLKCTEVPVSYRPRIGVSKISGTIKGSVRAGIKFLWIIAREACLIKSKPLLFSLIFLFLLAQAAIFYPDYDTPRMVNFLVLSQLMFVLSLAIFLIGRQFEFRKRDKSVFHIILFLAIVARLIMLVGAEEKMYLSDDIYRYVWDGKVTTNGINPFLYRPTAPELLELQDEIIFPNINHPWYPTIYPPMAQNIFAVSYLAGGDSIWAFKIICALFELLTIAALLVWMHALGINRANLILYLFSPLVLIEFYLSAHLDILAMPFLVMTLITVHRKKPALTGMFLAMASLVKFFGFFFVPLLLFYFKKRQRWTFLSAFLLTVIVLYLPYAIGSQGRFLGSLFTFLQEWHFSGSIYLLATTLWTAGTARLVCGGLFLAWMIYLLIKKGNIYQNQFWTFGGFIVLTPVFFPWYFIWIYPFLLRNLSPPFIYLSGTALLTYNVLISFYRDGYWQAVWWIHLLVYVPFYALLHYSLTRKETSWL